MNSIADLLKQLQLDSLDIPAQCADAVPKQDTPEEWLRFYCQWERDRNHDDFVRKAASVFISVTRTMPQLLYTPSALAMGAWMLSRFLCAEGRTRLAEDQHAFEVMTVLDRHLRNNHEDLYHDPPEIEEELRPVLDDICLLYDASRDYVPPIPLTLKMYNEDVPLAEELNKYKSDARRPGITLRSFPNFLDFAVGIEHNPDCFHHLYHTAGTNVFIFSEYA
ncbi:hypothetical protein GLOTRDRAFT_93142 [Gloeophyllum trabeum ATCC 11539]|uniref:Uncharacterized protein n=1 Tax=Gloeophyllum trabeum (strain ATCC 11539 / FP-39264 / Madison 617) TaxID=670483 RepID=S7RM86_GLOTA|nr:uncharacterized protein GLOTRDRAFT_93142 [Gloeophyllum trabeum ATCC 11539]EPQ55515.1 hypothetical protein GLOTRDRAFT_93142 [Gloeophyllum trabeum ATCC 11539]